MELCVEKGSEAAFRPNWSECPDWLGMCAKWGGGHALAVSEFLNHLLGNIMWKRLVQHLGCSTSSENVWEILVDAQDFFKGEE